MRTRHTTLVLFLCFLPAPWLCGPALAQTEPPMDETPIDSSYAGQPPSDEGVNAELESRVTHDDNVFNNNAQKSGDFVYQEGGLVNLWETRPVWNLALQYRPTFVIYHQGTSLNSFDQNLAFTGEYSFTPRLQLRWTEAFDDVTGLLEPSSNEFFSVPTAPPPTLNSTVLTPTAREISSASEAHILYQVSQRGSLDLMGTYQAQHFTDVGNSVANLFNTQGPTAAVAYEYRETQRLTLGARYLYQSFHYGLGGSDETHSIFLTGRWQVGPHADLSLYGGPAYSTTTGASSLAPLVNEIAGTIKTWEPVGGGSFTLRSDQTVFELSAEHSVNSGGGLLMTVTNSYEAAEVRHHFTSDWDWLVTAANGRSVALQGEIGRGTVNTQSLGTAFEHALFQKLGVHLEYDFLRQRSNEFVPLSSNVDRNEFSVAVFYQIGRPRL